MTDPVPKPQPLPYIDEADLLEIAGDLGAGEFPSADLYAWHVSALSSAGRLPVSRKRFGMTLRALGLRDSVKYNGGKMVRCWLITQSWVRKANARDEVSQ